jgi:hypothetical protein
MHNFLVLILASCILVSCATVGFDSDFDNSVALLDQADETCERHMKNAPMAAKEGFPILTNRKI